MTDVAENEGFCFRQREIMLPRVSPSDGMMAPDATLSVGLCISSMVLAGHLCLK